MARPCVPDLVRVGQGPVSPPQGISRAARVAERAGPSLVQSVHLADGAALQVDAAVCRIPSRVERHRSRLLRGIRATDLLGPSEGESGRPLPASAGWFQGGRSRRLRPLAVAGPGDVSVGSRRRAAPSDVWAVGPAPARRSLPRPEPPDARTGTGHEWRRLFVPIRHLQRQLRVRRVHHGRGQQRVRGRALVPGGARRRRRRHAPPYAGGVLFAARAVQRMGHVDKALEPSRAVRRDPRCDQAAHAAAAVPGTRRLRSTTSREPRSFGRCRSSPDARWRSRTST